MVRGFVIYVSLIVWNVYARLGLLKNTSLVSNLDTVSFPLDSIENDGFNEGEWSAVKCFSLEVWLWMIPRPSGPFKWC